MKPFHEVLTLKQGDIFIRHNIFFLTLEVLGPIMSKQGYRGRKYYGYNLSNKNLTQFVIWEDDESTFCGIIPYGNFK